MPRRPRVEQIPKYESIRTQQDGNRFYDTPLGYMPSVTTVLRNDKKFEGWRKWAGEKKANSILQLASARGTWTHAASEQFLLTGELPRHHHVYQPWFNSMKPFLDIIDHTLLTEGALWNADRYAGACDCIAYLKPDNPLIKADDPQFKDLALSQAWLIDFKTANKPIGGSKLYDYELQVSAYIKAANYVYLKEGLVIRQGLIACAVPDHKVQIFTIGRDDVNQLYAHFIERLEDWHEKNTTPEKFIRNPNNLAD